MIRLRSAALALAACSLAVPGQALAATAAAPASTDDVPGGSARIATSKAEAGLLVAINRARTRHGLREVAGFDACTDRLAEQWAARLARTGTLEHRDQNEVITGCHKSWAGETLVRGQGLSPRDMVRMWLDSPGHRAILLSPRARRAGIAIATDAEGTRVGVVNMVGRG